MNSNYWLYDWLDEVRAKSVDDVIRVLGSTQARIMLGDRARNGEESLTGPVSSDNSILAGAGMDLTTSLACGDSECRRKQVDRLFSRAWFYFDTVVAWDSCTHILGYHWDEDDTTWLLEVFLPFVDTVIYLRDIGAAPLIDFRKKTPTYLEYWEESLGGGGNSPLGLLVGDLAAKLLAEAQVGELTIYEDRLLCSFEHPLLDSISIHDLSLRDQPPSDDLARFAATRIAESVVGCLLSDVDTAANFGIPLGVSHSGERYLLEGNPKDLTASEVAFQLDLPFLDGVPIKTLLDIRRSEGAHFEKFRSGLRAAITEKVRLGNSADISKLTDEIRQDLIERELATIRVQLEIARRKLVRNAALNVAVGGLLTTCGLVAGMGASSLLGLAAPGLLSAGPFAKFFDENRDVELKDMFFLWQAVSHSRTHHQT